MAILQDRHNKLGAPAPGMVAPVKDEIGVLARRFIGLPGETLERSLVLVRLLLVSGVLVLSIMAEGMHSVWGVWIFALVAVFAYTGVIILCLAARRPVMAVGLGIAGDLALATVILPTLFFVGSRNDPENLTFLALPGVALVRLVIMMATLRLKLWPAIAVGFIMTVVPAGVAWSVMAEGASAEALGEDVVTFALVALVFTIVGQAIQKTRSDLSNQMSITTEQYAEARRRSSESEVLAEIGRIVSQTPDIHSTYERFADAVRGLIPADRVSVHFYEPDSDVLVTAYVSGQGITEWEVDTTHDPDHTHLGVVVRERRAIILGAKPGGTVPVQPIVNGASLGLASAVVVPLFHQGSLIGTLGLWSAEASSYDAKSGERLEQIGAQIAPAVANARLYSELANDARERDVFAEISRILSTTPDAPDAYADFVEQLGRLIRWERISVHAFDRTTGQLRTIYSTGRGGVLHSTVPVDLPRNFSVSEHVARTGEALLAADMNDLLEEFPGIAVAISAGLRSAMYVPLVSNGAVIGSLAIGADQVGVYKDADMDLLKRLAAQVAGTFANSELRSQTDRQAMEESALAEIGRIITSSADIGKVYDQFAAEVRTLMPADRVSIVEVDLTTNEMYVSHVNGMDVAASAEGARRKIDANGVFIHATNSTVGLSIPDLVEALPRFPDLERIIKSGIGSAQYSPLRNQGEVVGIICVASRRAGAYNDAHLNLLSRIGAQISGSIANARLREQADRQAREETVLAEIGRIINASLDIEVIYEQFADQVRQIIEFDRIALTRLGPGEGEYTISHVTGFEVPGLEVGTVWKLSETPFGPALEHGETMLFQRGHAKETEYSGPGMALSEKAGVNSSLVVPLIQQSAPVGFLSIRSLSENAYSDHDIALAGRVAALVSTAVTNSELLVRSNRQAKEEAALGEIGRIINASSRIEEVYGRFSDHLRTLMPADRVSVIEIDPDTGHMEIGNVREIPEDFPRLGRHYRWQPNNLMEMVARTGEGLFIPNLEEGVANDEALRFVFDSGVRSLLYTPLRDQSRVIGLLCVVSTHVDAYSEDHFRLIERISAQIAGALANARLQQRSTRQAREEATLGEIGRIINSSLDTEAIYDQFAAQVQTILQFDRLAIAIREPGATHFRVAHLTGMPVPDLNVGTVREIKDTNLRPLFEHREILVQQSRTGADRVAYVPGTSEGLSSSLILPLVSRDQVIGFIALRSREEEAYSTQQIALANRVSDLVATAISNSDLYERAEAQATERAVLAEVGRIVGSSLNIDAVYGRFTKQVGKLIKFDRISISYVNWSRHTAVSAWTGGETQTGFGTGREIPIKAFVGTRLGRLMRRRQGAVLDEQEIDQFFDQLPWSNDANVRSMICVPLISDGKAIAGLAVSSVEPGLYGERELEIASQIAAQVAGAVENARLHSDLEKASSQLEDINQQKTELMTTVAHELRSPLTAFNAFMELVLDGTAGEVPEKQLKLLQSASRSSVRMQNILDVFTHLEMAEDKDVPLIVTMFDIEGLIESALELLQPAARHSRVEVRFDKSGTLPMIEGDSEAINQVISNLVSNAIKYSHDGGIVSITCDVSGGDVIVSVSDTGFGISDEDQKRLFERFYRGSDPVKLQIRGTGLGLYVCKGLAERHNGRVWCESETGHGSTFSFALPVEQPDDVPVIMGSLPAT